MKPFPQLFTNPERSSDRPETAEVVMLRKKIYIVTRGRLNDGIQELDGDQLSSFLHAEGQERSKCALEDTKADRYLTYDFGKAAVRYAELATEESDTAATKAACDEIIFVEPEDFGDRLDLTSVERTFFRLPKKN